MTFTESPPPLPAAPGAHFMGSHLDTENLLFRLKITPFTFIFFLKSFAEIMICNARASSAAPCAVHKHDERAT